MSDDLDFDMEVVGDDELNEMGADGASSSAKEFGSEVEKEEEETTVENDSEKKIQDEVTQADESRKSIRWGPKSATIPGDWKFEPLEKYARDIIYPQRDKPTQFDGDIPWVRIEDLDGVYISEPNDGERYVSRSLIEEMNLRTFPEGSLMCSCSTTMGVCAITTRELLSNQTFAGIVTEDGINTHYLYYVIQSSSEVLDQLAAGSTISYLPSDKLADFHIQLPPLAEQRKTASVLYAVDQAIQKTEEIIEQAKRVKRGLMQVLLTRGVTDQGDVRDIDENEFQESSLGPVPKEWRVHNLGNDFDIEYGDEKKEKELVAEGYPVYGANGVIGRSKEYLYEDPVVTVTCRGATCGTVNLTEPRSWVTNNSLILVGHSAFNKHFLAEALRYHSVERAISGSAQPQITSGMLAKMDYPVPSVEEQNRIAEFLTAWEERVRHEKKIVGRLNGLKKGLMQDLLTGEVRTADKAIDVLDEVVEHG